MRIPEMGRSTRLPANLCETCCGSRKAGRKRVAAQYIGKLEAGVGRILDNPDLLRKEPPFQMWLVRSKRTTHVPRDL